jgi:hypothetical protein
MSIIANIADHAPCGVFILLLQLCAQPCFLLYVCPLTAFGTYNSSKYFPSTSLNFFPFTSRASSILSILSNPIRGLLTLVHNHTNATCAIVHPLFSATSSTRSMILQSTAGSPFAASGPERIVDPSLERGCARFPRERAAHCNYFN